MTRTLALAALALALALAAPAAEAAFPGTNGRIVFGAGFTRDDAIPPSAGRLIDSAFPNGRSRRSLRACTTVQGQPDQGDCSIEYRSPSWSPRGSTVAFDAGSRLALVRSDGNGFRLLPQTTAADGEPAWSPGGARLVFAGAGDLYVRNPRTGRVRRLTFRGGRSPAWSERGLIAFVRAGDVYTVRPSGRGLRRITHRRGRAPAWSPHGTKLAFVRGSRLYTVRASGRGLKRVPTPGADSPAQPAWSPDGRWIAYESFDSGVWAQRLDGTGLRQVAAGAVSGGSSVRAFDPDWQPLPRR